MQQPSVKSHWAAVELADLQAEEKALKLVLVEARLPDSRRYCSREDKISFLNAGPHWRSCSSVRSNHNAPAKLSEKFGVLKRRDNHGKRQHHSRRHHLSGFAVTHREEQH